MSDPMKWHLERESAKARRLALEVKFRADHGGLNPSPRAQRSRQFAYQIMGLVKDFVPDACREAALLEISLSAYDMDVEIVQVPPERDTELKAAFKAAEVAMMPRTITPGAIVD